MVQLASSNPFDLLVDDTPKTEKKQPLATADANKPAKTTTVQRAAKNEYPKRGGYAGKVIRPEDLASSDKKDRRQGRGGFRGGRGREFDRRSGTGRVDGEKKDVAGKGSWGDPIQSEITPATEGENKEEVPAEENAAPEEQDTTMTLAQYLASKKTVSVSKAPATRKANDGADQAQWKNAVKLEKADDSFIHLGKDEAQTSSKSKKEKNVKQFLAIEQKFSDRERPSFREKGRGDFHNKRGAPSERGARGGFGGERGGRGGRGRGGRPQSGTTYDRAFPALK